MSPEKPHGTCALHEQQLQDISNTVKDIHHRLFVDNGKPCMQTRLDRHDSAIGLLKWLAGTVGAAVIAIVVKMVMTQ